MSLHPEWRKSAAAIIARGSFLALSVLMEARRMEARGMSFHPERVFQRISSPPRTRAPGIQNVTGTSTFPPMSGKSHPLAAEMKNGIQKKNEPGENPRRSVRSTDWNRL